MNVLVYSGKGSTTEGVRHTIESLRQHLSPYYAVVTISEQAILHDPWMMKTAMLVLPGGADLPYCETLNGAGNRRIEQFVRQGGKFMGFCAGGYYASKRCEFEVGDLSMEVSGSRELAFFPGTCAGSVYKGFMYESHAGAKAVDITVNREAFLEEGAAEKGAFSGFGGSAGESAQPDAVGSTAQSGVVGTIAANGNIVPGTATAAAAAIPAHVTTYYNGGGMFSNASRYPGVEILARYGADADISDETGDRAASVFCKVGHGRVVLTGAHPEYTPSLMRPDADDIHFHAVAAQLKATDIDRQRFLGLLLQKIGLRVNSDPASTVPRLTPIHMASHLDPERTKQVVADLRENMDFVGKNTFEDTNDTFVLHDEDAQDHEFLISENGDEGGSSVEALLASQKHIKAYTSTKLPESAATPYFDMKHYFEILRQHYAANGVAAKDQVFGSLLLYAEVVTSTNTLLDANPNWLRYLPTGLTFTATNQIAGRGRGGNVWVNPHGVMATSILVRVKMDAQKNFNIVTLQYLCALAVIESILGYGSTAPGEGAGYEEMPLRLKWPNDMYALKPEYFTSMQDKDDTSSTVDGDEQKWAKVSGALVNSQFINGEFYLVWGCGVNVSNEAPTTSLNNVLAKLNEIRAQKGLAPLPAYKHEELLAKVAFTLGQFYSVFQRSGLKPFLNLYYKRWFHSEQRVKLDAEGNGNTRECVIKGITPEYGLLVAEDIATHESLELQPDGNSFDIFKGLVYKKR